MTPQRWAVLGLLHAAGSSPDRFVDPVGFQDHQTSCHDWRIALCLAHGVPIDKIDSASGHNLSGRSLSR